MPGHSPLTAAQQGQALGLLAAGVPERQVAAQLGVGRTPVRTLASKARALIEAEMEKLLQRGLAEAVDLQLRSMAVARELYQQVEGLPAEEARALLRDNNNLLRLGDKVAARILGIAGMGSSPSVGPAAAPIYVDARRQIMQAQNRPNLLY